MIDYRNSGRIDDLSNMTGITYRCLRCGNEFDGKELADRTEIKCPVCSFRVIQKARSPWVHRVKAK